VVRKETRGEAGGRKERSHVEVSSVDDTEPWGTGKEMGFYFRCSEKPVRVFAGE
jgi:hypothetical protein